MAGSLTRRRAGSCALRNGQAEPNYSLMLRWQARRAVHLDPCAARQHGQAGSGSQQLVADVELSPAPGQPGVSTRAQGRRAGRRCYKNPLDKN